jgi:hypothetical protein
MATIKILSPITSNGINPVVDEAGQIMYKETIVNATAKPLFEKINASLPTHLKRKIITDDEPVTKKKADDKIK